MVNKMKNEKYTTNSVNETIDLGERIGTAIKSGAVVSLTGDLGVGKTAFTKGLALGLGIEDTISSPTFTLMKEYEGRLDLKHIDAYRLEGVDSDSLGLFDLMDDRTVIVIEWGSFLDDLDFNVDYDINIKYIDETVREITVSEVEA
ncbi:tRNA (adenosine(37)-N6)-threonylcarbamoyltransferase complex ATPase subunit type 1 TsaE [Erysipelothrix inopinata]|uniref:tRNA threonylcarbamoyladenosine biosynthesis protein TsaE n=2 Tax=Erysipelothrix inopinata TaxID=225084 RepID=A0A7G9RZ26_9FIRM|nr:tRNA (adenosine(37)-N6)-threonylcarbamoyltransferase complex ATPase subunit type 1 TsaE [Erysipelothrix inopinata]